MKSEENRRMLPVQQGGADGEAAVLEETERLCSFVEYWRPRLVWYLQVHSNLTVQQAQDVWQETLVRLLEHIREEGFSSREHAKNWMHKVARNLAAEFWRGQARTLVLDPADPRLLRPASKSSLEEEDSQKNNADLPTEAILRVESMLKAVKPRHFEILSLRYGEQRLSYPAIARETGVPLGTIKSYVTRFRRRILKNLGLKEEGGRKKPSRTETAREVEGGRPRADGPHAKKSRTRAGRSIERKIL